ncbi:hypothetical protein FW774_08995 [Pedobacter sp. BS3]|uniref:hypothetical protein n=1 Tax=Pedobacter sp. BS3 TaxID=2567937 RepID=UPI0011F07BB4|nr:hypothetical protein [Pedobacter sp. BS3]TZF83605.1 hypothetical protein FW774_08995 [Pedobacter sp. BS3]
MVTKNDICFSIAMLFACWFAVTGVVWVYWIALVVAYPFGIASFFMWRALKKDRKKRNVAIPVILLAGLVASVSVLIYLVLGNR